MTSAISAAQGGGGGGGGALRRLIVELLGKERKCFIQLRTQYTLFTVI